MNYRELCFLSLFDLMLISSRTSAYYSKSYGEYNLTIRDNAGNPSQWTTQSGAQDWCRTNLNVSSLASVTNGDLQTNIEQFANDAVSDNYLSDNNIILNGQLEPTDWQWITEQSRTNAEVQGQTDESKYLLYAYLLTGNYSLMASKPTDKRSYLCQYSGDTSNCGDNRFKFNERCYKKYDTPRVSWFDARNNCQREGGDLASFDYLTKDTLSTLNSSGLYSTTSTDYWVGLKRLKWKWLDSGSEANFTYWSDGHPSDYNKKCICLGSRNNYKWKWLECDCNAYRQFICFTVLSQTTTLHSTPISPINPTPVSSTPLKPSASSSSSLAPGSSLKSNDISTTPANSSESSQQKKSDQALEVGLGVGLGVGVPLIILLIVVVALLIRKRKRNPVVINKSKSSLVNDSLESPQIEMQNDEEILSTKDQPSGIYALVLQQKEGSHDQAEERQPVVYDKIEHINQH